MSFKVFTSNPSALIAQPGRAVNTFPSGLVRVDQSYIGLTSHALTHRATLAVGNNMPDGDSYPCIDGLKIFPDSQEVQRGDGFTEYIVSAYGRTNTTGKVNTIRMEWPTALTFTAAYQAQTSGGWPAYGTGMQWTSFSAKVNFARQIFIEKTSLYNSSVGNEELNTSLLSVALSSMKITSSPTNADGYFAYIIHYSDFQVTTTIQKTPDIVVTIIFNAIIDNPTRVVINQQWVYYGAGTRVEIGRQTITLPDPTSSLSIKNFGSFNEMSQQFII